ncbi:MAG: glycosyltransferase family 2 protein [Planctomycetes bacterium]|nr:glycosyltransferase family 2 protein [Planctomycetota bacterium]
MTGTRIPLTLVMVSYNKADTVGLSIESAATGSRKPDLIVLSDDGSSDGSPDVAEAAARRHGIPIHIVRHPRVGVFRLQTMRNTCTQNALDDGIVFLSDSDCLFGEFAIETHERMHLENPVAVGTGPRFEFLQGNSGPFTTTFTTLEFAHFPTATYVVPVGANYSFRKSLWERLGGFDRAYDGAYGMDEFEFALRAEQAGAVCVSDPGAYVFHIPHETVFGNRAAFRNIGVFDRTFGISHVAHEDEFIRDHAVPHYWRGGRKTPRVGARLRLDRYGAPDGFRPPIHLRLMHTLEPLLAPARRLVEKRGHDEVIALRGVIDSIKEQLLARVSPGNIFQQDLRAILRQETTLPRIVERVKHWLAGADLVEAELLAHDAAQAVESGAVR